MNEIGAVHLVSMISAMAHHVGEDRERLNRLDANLGDGDHGSSICSAFELAVEQLTALDQPNPSEVWQISAKALMNAMGGASGALFGTLFLKGVSSIRGKQSLSKADMEGLLRAGLTGVKQRGKAEIGDKTMVDALQPAVLAFSTSADFNRGWQAAAKAAMQGAESTKDMLARQGRAKFLGERAMGHQDAGATTIALMFEAIRDWWEENG